MRRESPPALPAYIQNLLSYANAAIDNIFGTHSTSRGERGEAETLGGRLILKQGDISRNSTLVKQVDDAVAQLANYAVQLMKLYFVNTRTIKVYGANGLEFVEFSRDNIEDGMELLVEEGTTLPKDEFSQAEEALRLYQMGALDPVTLFERLKYPNPQEAAERLMAFRAGKLLPSQEGIKPQEAASSVAAEEKGREAGQGLAPLEELAEARKNLAQGGQQ